MLKRVSLVVLSHFSHARLSTDSVDNGNRKKFELTTNPSDVGYAFNFCRSGLSAKFSIDA